MPPVCNLKLRLALIAQFPFSTGLIVSAAIGVSALPPSALAQNVTLDGTLGTPQVLTGPNYTIPQTAGQTVKQNLFQSFGRFNLNAGEKATFESAPEIRNIFSRVTGGEQSNINGTIATQGQNTNLFFINPNGILFGPSARLDVSGSFVGTTANSINFADGTRFSANPAQSSPVLTVSVPLGLQFGSNPGPITVQGNGKVPSGLGVKSSSTLGLIGSEIALQQTGGIFSPGGNLEVGSVGDGSFVGVSAVPKGWAFDYAKTTNFRDVQLREGGFILSNGASAGDIHVQGRKIGISGLSSITSATLGDSDQQSSGTIKVTGTESVRINGNGSPNGIFSNVFPNGKSNGASINIQTPSLSLQNEGAAIQSRTNGQGKAGNITIDARDIAINTEGVGAAAIFSSNRSKSPNRDAGGNIIINTNSLTVKNGGGVRTISEKDNSGNILINALDRILVTGELSIPIGKGENAPFPSSIFTSATIEGNAGDISIQTGILQLEEGGRVTSGRIEGNTAAAGNISIDARDSIIVSGSKPLLLEGKITTSASSISILNNLNSGDSAPAKDIRIKTGSLSVTNGASISTQALEQGEPGKIVIQARDGVTVSGTSDFRQNFESGGFTFLPSKISTDILSPEGSSKAGRIQIDAKSLSVIGGAQISSNTQGIGEAGDVSISAKDKIFVTGTSQDSAPSNISSSTLSSATGAGNGGSINLNADSLQISKGAQLSSSTLGKGQAGDINVNARDTAIVDPGGIFTVAAVENAKKGGNILLKGQSLSITNGGEINAQSSGQGNAGAISIHLDDQLTANNGFILNNSKQTSGGGVFVKADSIRLFGNSNIKTDVANGMGTGGNIILSANTILALNDSDILAFAKDGQGGNINLNTRAFLGQNFRPAPSGTDPETLDFNNRVDVNASGATSGIISLPDSDFIQNSFVTLSDNLINTDTLLANSCIRREKKNGTFYITGSGNLPVAPGNPVPYTTYDTADVRPTKVAAKSAWKQGDAIVEPQGVFTLANGNRVMSRLCPGEAVSNTSRKPGLGHRS